MSDSENQAFLDEVHRLFEESIARHPAHEDRPQQLQMALAVARAISLGELLVVEAGTGTGKSLAYLIPALLWSLKQGRPVVISTRTLNLQQQLMEKDIPLLRSLMEVPFRAAQARGWSNFVCLRRLHELLDRPSEPMELKVQAGDVVEQLEVEASGVRQRLRASDSLWNAIQAESSACSRQFCSFFSDCYLFKERAQVAQAQIIVANHSLVMADLSLRQDGAQGLFPTPEAWILDEGHHLEAVASEHLGRGLQLADLKRLRQAVYDPEGGVQAGGWLPSLRERLARPGAVESRLLKDLDLGLLMALPTLYQGGFEFFHWLDQALQQLRSEGRITLNGDFFHSSEGMLCRAAWETWSGQLGAVAETSRSLAESLTAGGLEAIPGLAELSGLGQRLQTWRSDLEFCLFPESPDWVYWAQTQASNVELGATPLDIGGLLSQEFFEPARSAVITSATLAIGQDLSYFQQRVGLEPHSARLRQLCLESPFNYREQAYVGAVRDLPDSNQPGFWNEAAEGLLWLFRQLGGRSFLLTTSLANLRQAQALLAPGLAQSGIALLCQGDLPPGLLVEQFRRNPRSVLLGADSFWEGVDIPGADLSCVVMTRLPFRVPSDPMVRAHCRRLEEEGKSSFAHYQLPQAILRFRQGFGRLIRTGTDRGLILVLDSRLSQKSYGRQFLEALPPCTRRAGRLPAIVQDAWQWLNSSSSFC